MVSLLIAEDEEIERNFFRQFVETSTLKIEHIYTAKNGEEALQLYQQYVPDLVFLDINMPIYDGLEVLKRIRNTHGTKSKVYILTSYNYFSYAQKAIHLGVEDFFLKPFDTEQLYETLEKAVEMIEKEKKEKQEEMMLADRYQVLRPYIERNVISMVLGGGIEEEVIIQLLQTLDIRFTSGCCILVETNNGEKESLSHLCEEIERLGYHCLGYEMKEVWILFIIASFQLRKEDIQTIKKCIQKEQTSALCMVGSIQNEVNSLFQSYEHARNNREEVVNDTEDISFYYTWLDRLYELITMEKESLLRETIRNFVVDLLRQANGSSKKGNQLFQSILSGLYEKIHQDVKTTEEEEGQSLPRLDFNATMEEIELQVSIIVMRSIKIWKLMRYQNLDHLTKKTMDYIEKNYKKSIGLHDVAEYLNVSDSHLSRVLSKNNNKGFVDLLNDYRIQKAKQMIRKGVPLKNVTDQCGFRSQSYFTKIFKKLVGISPKEYRNMFYS